MRVAIAVLAIVVVAAACSQSTKAGPSGTHPGGTRTAGANTKSLPARPSPGCSSSAHAELTLEKRTVNIDGALRWYLISTPPEASVDRPLPVVLDFHGIGEGAALEAQTTQFSPLGKKDGFISVFPQGVGNLESWDSGADSPSNRDLTFVSQILDQIEASECVDETRIYATGYSDGAFMTSTLACAMSDRIAAFAPVSGVQLMSPCAATRRVPILAFHGTADPILYFNGGVGSAVLTHAFYGTGPAPSLSGPPRQAQRTRLPGDGRRLGEARRV